MSSKAWYYLIGFSLLVLTVLLWQPTGHLISLAKPLDNPPAQDSQETVAVLFLIDESGGMNRQCAGADYAGEVLDVDSETRLRYAIPRFFMAYLGSVYDPNYGRQDKTNLPSFEVGIAQYADGYEVVYPFRPAHELFDESHIPEEAHHNLDPCYTNYVYALDSAARTLKEETEAENKILILITDGSFRGSEYDWSATEAKHTEIRNEVAKKIQEIRAEGIHPHVFLLEKDYCYEDKNCSLGQKEYDMRVGDIQRWVAWDNMNQPVGDEAYIELLDEDDIIESLMNLELKQGTTIGDRLTPGVFEVDRRSPTHLLYFPHSTLEGRVNVVSLLPIEEEDYLELFLGKAARARKIWPGSTLGAQWWMYEFQFSPPQIPHECAGQNWTFWLKDTNNSVLVWKDQVNQAFDDSTLTLSVPPTVVFNEDAYLEASAEIAFENIPDLFNASCYHVVFQLREENGDLLDESIAKQMANSPISHRFNLSSVLPSNCKSRQLEVETQINEIVSDTLQLSKSQIVYLYFRPEVLADEIVTTTSSKPNVSHVITVPVRYGADQCNPGIVPEFRFTSEPDGLRHVGNCPGNDGLHPRLDANSDLYALSAVESGTDMLYVLELKTWGNGKTYRECGYCTLLIDLDADGVQEPVSYQYTLPIFESLPSAWERILLWFKNLFQIN